MLHPAAVLGARVRHGPDGAVGVVRRAVQDRLGRSYHDGLALLAGGAVNDEREAVKVPRRPHERDCGLAGDVRPGLDAPVSAQPDAVRSDDRVDGVDLDVARGGDRQQVRVVELGGGLAQPRQIDEDRRVSLWHARSGLAGVFAQVRGGSGQP